jgi:putative polyhydroxyalkanoate system protein
MTKTITVSVPHRTTRAEAKQRVMQGVAGHKQRFASMAQVTDTWTDDRMEFKATAMGQNITGRVDVTDDAVVVNVDLPMFLAMLAGKIKGEIETEGRKMLEEKK